MEKIEQINKILEKVEYLSLEFEYGKALVSTMGTMTIKTQNGTLKVATTAAQYEKFIRGAGFLASAATVIDAGVNVSQYANGEISGAKLGYRLTGTAASLFAPMVTGAIVGSEVPVLGTVVGIIVGATFGASEYLFDNYPAAKESVINNVNRINNIEGALRHWGY